MVTTQPVFSFKYFHFRKNRIAKGIKRLFYLSWEDALWDILQKKKVPKNSYVLVPDFYCTDVEKNINQHGYKVATYKFLKNLKADKNDFENTIKRYSPVVIVVFHPVGISSNLFDDKIWLKRVTGKSILIEDSVHRILDSSKIKIFKKNHFVIDSLRKVVPVQGSNVYGKEVDLDFSSPPFFQSFVYKMKVNLLWFLMEICLRLKLFPLAERLMITGYDLIGDSKKSASGTFLANLFAKRINIKKLTDIKKCQVLNYESKLGNILKNHTIISGTDKGGVRGYPIILPVIKANKILKYLRSHTLLVRFELDGCGWSKKQKIIYLPLGIHLSKKSQDEICFLVNEATLKV